MAFIPTITTSYDVVDKKISVTDTSEWGGDTNPILADVNEVVITVYKNDLGNTYKVVDVTDTLKDGLLNDYEIPELTIVEDGLYIVFLSLNTEGYQMISEYQYTSFGSDNYIISDLENNISLFWVKHACASSTERKKGLEDICIWLESSLAGLKALASRKKNPEFVDTLKIMQRKIELNKTYLR